tara:strand:+ start:306 stop:1214 length:909 start_codon:yes stop_codon:yes gene_type:complete
MAAVGLGTLATIGVAAGIASAGVGIAGAGISFGQAAKQRRRASQAAADSARVMQQARNRMQVNTLEELRVPLEAYERGFRENTAQQRQAIDSLQGADARTLAAGIGKVGALGTASNEAMRIAMGEDLYKLNEAQAKEEGRIKENLVDMDTGQAADFMKRSQDEQAAATQSVTGGVQALTSGLAALGTAAPLYGTTIADKRAGVLAGKVAENKTAANYKTNQTYIDPKSGLEVNATDPNFKAPEGYNPKAKPGEAGYADNMLYRPFTQEEIAKKLREQNFTGKQYREFKKSGIPTSILDSLFK